MKKQKQKQKNNCRPPMWRHGKYFSRVLKNVELGYSYPKAWVYYSHPIVGIPNNVVRWYIYTPNKGFEYIFSTWNNSPENSRNFKKEVRRNEKLYKLWRELPKFPLQKFLATAKWKGRPYKEIPLCR